jgi:hypothetical protein
MRGSFCITEIVSEKIIDLGDNTKVEFRARGDDGYLVDFDFTDRAERFDIEKARSAVLSYKQP